MTGPTFEGACLCGRVRLKVSAPPILTMACHCKGCQKLSASAFSLTAMVPADALSVEGATRIGALHGPSQYHYCAHCLNWLYTAPAAAPIVNVRATMFREASWSTPYVESYVCEKLPWATTPAKHSFDRFPGPEHYQSLMQGYATEGSGA